MSGSSAVIEASGLTKQFGAVYALNRVSIRVDRGDDLTFQSCNSSGY